jgi:TonB family protein
MPAAVAEKPKPQQPKPAPPSPPQYQPPPKPKAAPQPVPVAAPAPAPVPRVEPRPEPRPEPQPHPAEKVEKKTPPLKPEKSAEAKIFKDIYEVDKKKSPAPFIAVGAGLVIVAAVGFFLLRPKHPANPAGAGQDNPTTMTQSSVPEKSQETTLPPLSEEKLRAVNPKPKAAPANQNRQAEALPSADEAILQIQAADASRLAIQVPAEKKPEAKPTEQKPSETKPGDTKASEAKSGDTKTAETQTSQAQQQPPVKTETAPPQVAAGGGTDAASQAAPAPKANTGDLVDLAAADEQPRLLKSVEPNYPALAARSGKEGTITVNALINESGNVVDTGILKGLKDDMGLEKAAEAAVRKWKFQPAKKDGVNVKVWKPVVITFKASRSKTT